MPSTFFCQQKNAGFLRHLRLNIYTNVVPTIAGNLNTIKHLFWDDFPFPQPQPETRNVSLQDEHLHQPT